MATTFRDFESLVDWCVQPSETPGFANLIGASLVADFSDPEGPDGLLGAWDGYLRFRPVSEHHGHLEGQLSDVKGVSSVDVNFAFPSFGANCSLEFHDLPPSHVGTIFTDIVKDRKEAAISQFIAGDPVTDVAVALPATPSPTGLGTRGHLTVHMWKTTAFDSGF